MANTFKDGDHTYIVLHDGSILVVDRGEDKIHRLNNPSGTVTTIPLTETSKPSKED